ncbi:MAG: class I SAM-dependent methyltransferase family protein [Promethearchaeota archaeon]
MPRRLRVLGHTAILWLNPQLFPFKEMIGQAVLKFDSKIRSVLMRTSAISGPFRQPSMELIAGTSDTETSFRENGCIFNLDPMKVMFSVGNKAERIRISHLGRNEFVVDMFAGIGQFSIPMAVHSHPRLIHAIEWNPDAFHYLQQNIKANHVSEIIKPHFGDTGVLAPKVARGQADRVLMGLIQGTTKYLNQGIRCLKTGGILHVHEIGPRTDTISEVSASLEKAAQELDRQVTILATRTVKTFSPRWNHFVLDVQVDDASD